MATSACIPSATIFFGSPALCLARFLGFTGSYLIQSNASSITYKVVDMDNAEEVVSTGTFPIATTIYDTLQTDLTWVKDATGYNFRAIAAASFFPTAGRRYRVVFTIVSTWGNLVQPFEFYVVDAEG